MANQYAGRWSDAFFDSGSLLVKNTDFTVWVDVNCTISATTYIDRTKAVEATSHTTDSYGMGEVFAEPGTYHVKADVSLPIVREITIPEDVADTADVSYVDAAVSNATSTASGALATHTSDTTAVHGIADTALLETQTGAQAKADAAQDGAEGKSAAILSSFEGTNGWHYAHSFGTVVGSGTLANVSSSFSICSQRVAKRLSMGSMTQRATAGYWAMDVTTATIVGANAHSPNAAGLALWDGTENDLLSDGGTVQGIRGYKNAVRAFLWTLFSSTRLEHTDPSFTFPTGTWASESAAAEFSGGTANSSDSNGAVCSISFTGTDAVLFLIGRQDGETVNAVPNVVGGNAQVQVDGVTVATQSLSNQFVKSTTTSRARCPVAVPLLGMTSGAHTITVTNVGASGTRLTVDCIAPISVKLPEVLMFRQCYFPSDQYVNFSTPAGVDAFNAALEQVVNEFIALGKPVQTVHIENGFDVNTMLSIAQRRHPNDLGMKHYADLAIELIKEKSFRSGINNL